jgi:hypothetical protein
MLFGSEILVKFVQFLKIPDSKVFTLLGILIVVKVQPAKALCPIHSTVSGIDVVLHPHIKPFVSVLIIALQLSRESYEVLSGLTIMLFKFLQSSVKPQVTIWQLLGI